MEVYNINFCCFITIFCCAMLCKRGISRHAVSVRLSARVSVTFVHSVKTNKYIFNFLSPSGSHTILIFSVPNVIAIFWRNPPPPNGGVECTWGMEKSGFWLNIWLHHMLWTLLRPAAINTIPGYRSMPAGVGGINWRWSVQWCITDCHGASLFTAQKATHQWIRRREEKRT